MSYLEYELKDNIIHRMNPLTKLLYLLVIFIGSALLRDIFSLTVLVIFSLVWWYLGEIPFSKLKSLVAAIAALVTVFIVVQGFVYFTNKTPLFWITIPQLGIHTAFYLEGFVYGIVIGLKIIAIVASVPVLTLTTPTSKLIVALAKIRLPYSLIFVLATAMRFTPLIIATYSEIIDAQKIRGHDIDKMGIIEKMRKAFIPIVTPMFISLLKRADELQISIESRAFGAVKNRTYVEEIKIRASDIIAMAILITLLGLIIFGVIMWGTLIWQSNPLPAWFPFRDLFDWFVFKLPDWAMPPMRGISG
ncbi:MAG: energy-coupling factor transporter transmembrane component T family protein [Candidatus Asgardarchaeia archaeon]